MTTLKTRRTARDGREVCHQNYRLPVAVVAEFRELARERRRTFATELTIALELHIDRVRRSILASPMSARPENEPMATTAVWLSTDLVEAMRALAAENRRKVTAEALIAIEGHLQRASMSPPPGPPDPQAQP